jgi:hypothetical protein
MKIGDLIYHVDDWSDKKPVVGIILAFASSPEGHRAKIIFTDKTRPEWWRAAVLKHVE